MSFLPYMILVAIDTIHGIHAARYPESPRGSDECPKRSHQGNRGKYDDNITMEESRGGINDAVMILHENISAGKENALRGLVILP